MKIVDGFTFYNEIDMLKLRLEEMNDVIDYFILVESKYTFTGNPKPLFYEINKKIFEKFNDKIIHIIVDDMPNTNNAWDNEIHQRNCIQRGVSQLSLSNDDLIIISDVDEIVNPEILKQIKHGLIPINDIMSLRMDFYYYNFNNKFDHTWVSAKIAKYSLFSQLTPNNIRRHEGNGFIDNSGWHLSYFGNVDFIKNKVENISHQEKNTAEIKNSIEDCITKNICFTHPDIKITFIEISNNNFLPKNYRLLIK